VWANKSESTYLNKNKTFQESSNALNKWRWTYPKIKTQKMNKICIIILLIAFHAISSYSNVISVTQDGLVFTAELVEVKPIAVSSGNRKQTGRLFDISIYVKNTGSQLKRVALGKSEGVKFHSKIPLVNVSILMPRDSHGDAIKPPEADLRIVNLYQEEKALLCYYRAHIENSHKMLKFLYSSDEALAAHFKIWYGVINISIPLP
jgi:hypothetical protein